MTADSGYKQRVVGGVCSSNENPLLPYSNDRTAEPYDQEGRAAPLIEGSGTMGCRPPLVDGRPFGQCKSS